MSGPAPTSLERFADQVGPSGPVVPVGGRTQWDLGGAPDAGARAVSAPAGVVSHLPEEMIVRVRAGTTVADLDAALTEGGQMIALDPRQPSRATVGGVLAAGQSGPRRLRWGPLRDAVLEARFVTAEGQLARAGGPVVKNVSGFDLCRLLVGSLGTIGLLGEVVLRTQPRPRVSLWLREEGGDPEAARRASFRPSSILWDGRDTWVLLEGDAAEVSSEAGALGRAFEGVETGPALPTRGRLSLRPGDVTSLPLDRPPGSFVAEVGVGTVHLSEASARPALQSEVARRLNHAVKARFDPLGRLNPGRSVA